MTKIQFKMSHDGIEIVLIWSRNFQPFLRVGFWDRLTECVSDLLDLICGLIKRQSTIFLVFSEKVDPIVKYQKYGIFSHS